MKAYGIAAKGAANAGSWRYPGILFYFDGFQNVRRIVIFKR